jgi:hypothetical protein
MNEREFSVKIEDKDVKFLVRSPSFKNQREAQKVYNTAFTDAIKSDAVVRAKMEDVLREQGIWNDEKEKELTELQNEIIKAERVLAQGGISLKKAKSIALEMKETRDKIRELLMDRNSLDNNSAEGQADNTRFNYLVTVCTVYKDTEKPYFKDMDDYLEKNTDPVAVKAAQVLANMLYGLSEDYEQDLAENKFLKKYKFIDEKLRSINDKGQLVDEENRLIDENGRFINEKGEYVDKFGFRIDFDGNYVVEFSPFLDDDGKPVEVAAVKEEEPVKAEEPAEENKQEPVAEENKPDNPETP